MKLSNLLSSIDLSLKTEDYQVTDIVSNGNNIKQNCIFVCIKGEHFDSHTLISEALNKGACAIICSEKTEIDNEKIYQVCDTRRALAILYFTFENVKTENLEFFAITGTNGKTTVTTIINHILKSFNLKTGLIGTIENCIGDDHSKAFATTPEPVMLAKLIKKMEENNCKTIVLEASSQALYQQRLASIKFKIAAFTNFSVDHLDYHKTMEEYFSAKKMLFEKCDIAVLNGDDKNVMTISEKETLSYKTFSIKNLNCDFFASEIGYYDNAVNFIINYRNFEKRKIEKAKVWFNMPGEYSVYNALCAVAVCVSYGLDFKKCAKSLYSFKGVKGRCQYIKTGKGFKVIIDFAHTPQGLEKMLWAVKKGAKGRIILVFGCGGDRDKTKRPQMGLAAAKGADYIFLTSDNPRTEDPYSIISDVEAELKNHTVPYEVYVDRKIAIENALRKAKKDDIVILAGKGHEDYQIIGTKINNFDEEKIVKEILKNM